MEVKLNLKEAEDYLKKVIINNYRLEKETGRKGVAISLCSEAGVGKTSVVKAISNSGINVRVKDGESTKIVNKSVFIVKLSAAQIEEVGDAIGFPITEYKCEIDGEMMWVPESEIKNGKYTGKSRMGYAIPAWLEEGISSPSDFKILLIDDYTRAAPHILQALMEVLDQKETTSWKLGPEWSIVLTENPANGSYQVEEVDAASASRKITWNVKYDNEIWCEWALNNQIDQRLVNFVINSHGDIYGKNDALNPRIVTKLFDTIKYVPDFSSNEGKAFVMHNAHSIVPGKDGVAFAALLNSFINDNLDKIPTPEQLLNYKDTKTVISKLKECITVKGQYRNDIGSILMFRVANYLTSYKGKLPQLVITNTVALLESDEIAEDLNIGIAVRISKKDSKIFGRILASATNKTILNKLIG